MFKSGLDHIKYKSSWFKVNTRLHVYTKSGLDHIMLVHSTNVLPQKTILIGPHRLQMVINLKALILCNGKM